MAQSEEEHLKDPETQAESAETGAEAGLEDQVSDETPTDSDEAQSASEPLEVSAEKALEEALADVEKFKDTALRAEAEMQNMQRRTARDVENAHKFGLERFLQNLLPVVDSLEKAIESTHQAGDDAGETATSVNRIQGWLIPRGFAGGGTNPLVTCGWKSAIEAMVK